MNWAASIVSAIEDSRVLVLVFSAVANDSQQVLREVERAVAKRVTILPFRIQDVKLSKDMEYFISAAHWLDATAGEQDASIRRLIGHVRRVLARQSNPDAPSADTGSAGALTMTDDRSPRIARRSVAWIVAAVLCIALLGLMSAMWWQDDAIEIPPPAESLAQSAIAPATCQGAYEIDLKFTRVAGDGFLTLYLPSEDTCAIVHLGQSQGSGGGGVTLAGGRRLKPVANFRAFKMKDRQAYTARMKVAPDPLDTHLLVTIGCLVFGFLVVIAAAWFPAQRVQTRHRAGFHET